MKNSKPASNIRIGLWLTTSVLLISFLCLSFQTVAQEEKSKDKSVVSIDVKSVCSDANKLRREMPALKEKAIEYVGTLDAKTFSEKLEKNDDQLMVISSLWPDLFVTHLMTYKTYSRCAELHRDIIDLRGKIKKQRLQEKVQLWKDCLGATYGEQQPLPKGIADLVECYAK